MGTSRYDTQPRPLRSSRLFRLLILIIVFIILPYRLFSRFQQWRHPSSGLNLAYATLLLEDSAHPSEKARDEYFVSVRILNYQLQHDEKTRTKKNIPFIVLTTEGVDMWKVAQLSMDGATIVPVEKLDSSWIKPGHSRWQDVMVKLRLWELVDYDRILFLDADTFILKNIDGVFDDAAAQPRRTLHKAPPEKDEGKLPREYLLGTISEVTNTIHEYPPIPMGYFNAGFFVMEPNVEVFEYYTSLFDLGRFDSVFPEQNLLNYAHRLSGNMPWTRLHYSWNIQLPTMRDVKKGVHSVHAKLWTEGNDLQPIPKELRELWKAKKLEMWEYYTNGMQQQRRYEEDWSKGLYGKALHRHMRHGTGH